MSFLDRSLYYTCTHLMCEVSCSSHVTRSETRVLRFTVNSISVRAQKMHVLKLRLSEINDASIGIGISCSLYICLHTLSARRHINDARGAFGARTGHVDPTPPAPKPECTTAGPVVYSIDSVALAPQALPQDPQAPDDATPAQQYPTDSPVDPV